VGSGKPASGMILSIKMRFRQQKNRHWSYLHTILERLPDFDESLLVLLGLIIGGNCPKALEPHEVICRVFKWRVRYTLPLGWRINWINRRERTGEHGLLPYWIHSPTEKFMNEVCFNLDFVEKNSFKGIDISYCLEKMYNMDFPEVRNNRGWSFTYSGMDMFGSFYVKDGEKQLKRFVTLFTCFSERVIHLESNVSMDADFFIQTLRRFMPRRGPVREITLDNG